MSKPVTKAIIAAAGYGSRFLPLTKAIPKEMLPLVDKPVVQHIVEELVIAGITDIIIVTSDGKPAIQEHFSTVSDGLKQNLLNAGKTALLEKAEAAGTIANFHFVQQTGPYGNATPVMNAAHLIDDDESFIYAFADDFVSSRPNRFQQLIDQHNDYGGSILTCIRLDKDIDYGRYGYVGGPAVSDNLTKVETIIEKPGSRQAAPSDLASVSGYLLEGSIFKYLERQLENYDTSKEFQIQDAMQRMIEDGLSFYGCEVKDGHFYDAGNPLEYMKTVFDFALAHHDIGKDFRDFVIGHPVIASPKPRTARQPKPIYRRRPLTVGRISHSNYL